MKKLLLSAALIAASCTCFAQVGIGTGDPHASSVLEIDSTTKGLLPPRMTKQNITDIATPAEGLMAYCLDCSAKGFFLFNGNNFVSLIDGIVLGAAESATALNKIGSEAATATNATITFAELNDIVPALTGLTADNILGYQAYIDSNRGNFSNPASLAEVQTMIDAVNTAATSAAKQKN